MKTFQKPLACFLSVLILASAFCQTLQAQPFSAEDARIARLAGLAKVPGVTPYYGVAKAGVIQLTREAAVEAGEFGIRVNAVVPGSVRTPSLEAFFGSGFDAYVEQLPLRRMVEPGDIANVVAFLASDEAAAITGVAIPVDCGQSAVLYQPSVG